MEKVKSPDEIDKKLELSGGTSFDVRGFADYFAFEVDKSVFMNISGLMTASFFINYLIFSPFLKVPVRLSSTVPSFI